MNMSPSKSPRSNMHLCMDQPPYTNWPPQNKVANLSASFSLLVTICCSACHSLYKGPSQIYPHFLPTSFNRWSLCPSRSTLDRGCPSWILHWIRAPSRSFHANPIIVWHFGEVQGICFRRPHQISCIIPRLTTRDRVTTYGQSIHCPF